MSSNEYFSFRKLISSSLIRFIYIIGAIFVTLMALAVMFGAIPYAGGFVNFLAGIFFLVLGNLMWRVTCEVWMVFFGIHDRLSSIEVEVKRSGTLVKQS